MIPLRLTGRLCKHRDVMQGFAEVIVHTSFDILFCSSRLGRAQGASSLCAMKIYFFYFVGTTRFINKSSIYINIVYLKYFTNIHTFNEYFGGSIYLAYLYSQLNEARKFKTIKLVGHICLFKVY